MCPTSSENAGLGWNYLTIDLFLLITGILSEWLILKVWPPNIVLNLKKTNPIHRPLASMALGSSPLTYLAEKWELMGFLKWHKGKSKRGWKKRRHRRVKRQRQSKKRRRTSTKETVRLQKRRKKKRKERTIIKDSKCFWIDRIQIGTPNWPTNSWEQNTTWCRIYWKINQHPSGQENKMSLTPSLLTKELTTLPTTWFSRPSKLSKNYSHMRCYSTPNCMICNLLTNYREGRV